MSSTNVSYTGDGATVLYTVTFPYLKRSHVFATIDGSGTTAFSFANDTTIQFDTAPANGAEIVLFRQTTADAVDNTFFPNSSIRSSALNDNFLQTLYVSEEARNAAADAQLGDLVPGSIGTEELADGAITDDKVSETAAIDPTKIAGTAVITTDPRLSDQRVPTDGSVTNAKVSNSAAIDGTKISPDFGNQNVVTTGDVQGQDIVASGDVQAQNVVTTGDVQAQNVVTTGDVQGSSINGGPLAGFRNAVINGNFDFWARGTSQTAVGYGSADRWVSNIVGTACTLSRQAFTLGQTDVPGGPTYYMRAAVTSSAGAGNNSFLQQRVEGVRTFEGQQVTLSFWAKADASKNISIEFVQFFGFGGSPSSSIQEIGVTKVGLTTSWQKVVVTATLPSIAGKTLGTDGDDALRFNIFFDAGSDFNSRTDSLGQQSGTFDIAQVQLEPGPVATQFERRPEAIERTLCERYFIKNGVGFTASQFSGDVTSGQAYQAVTHFSTRMRTAPTVTLTNAGAAAFPTTPGNVATNAYGFQEQRTANATGRGAFLSGFEADAEI